ncbi:MAG: anthrax toxin-like adenylyl cyclase domain-containing protein [Gammaproteobacteria bacterium]
MPVLAITLCLSHALPAADSDWEVEAARAAQTERGFYATGGARDTAVIPEGAAPVAADPQAHIREADRKVAELHARRLAEQRAAEQAASAPLVEQRARAREQHGRTITNLRHQLTGLEAQLRAAEQDKARAEASIQAYDDNVDWLTGTVETVAGAFGGRDPEAVAAAQKTAAETRISTLQGQIANVSEALQAQVAEAQSFDRRLQIEIAKTQSDARNRLQAARIEEARALARAYHTQVAATESGQSAFQTRIATIDAAIRQAEKNGLTEVAAQFRKDRDKTVEAHQQWLERQNAIISGRRADLDRVYAQNRADGIGPTNDTILGVSLRTQARARDEDPLLATDLVDEEIVARSRSSTESVAEGAPRSTEHISIFNEVSTESLSDFALDYAAEARVTYGSWEGFKNRVLKGYTLGVLKGGRDIVKDLVTLVIELGDTAGESLEDAIERLTGAELDLFGDENMQAMRAFLRSADALIRDEDGAGGEEAARLVAAAEAIKRVIDRKTEQMAGRGEAGIVEALDISGQVAINLVGVETVAVQAVSKGSKLLRGVNAVDELAAVAGKADEVAVTTGRAGDVAPGAARTATSTSCPVGQRRLDLVSRVRSKLARLRSNIVPAHGEVFVDVAVKRNEVVMVRPVNQFSTRLISDNFSTKNMGIKGKSADWGPQRGTIPVDPKYSKLGNPTAAPPSPDELRIYENYNRKALGMEYQTPAKNEAGEIIRDAEGNVASWVTHAAEPPIAKAVPFQGPDGEIMVLADLSTGKPITADYDLFAVGTQKGHGQVLPFDPELGVISETEMATVEWINEGVKAKGYTGGNVAHHGPANRFENTLNPKSDFPITAFTPDGNAHTITDVAELNDFFNTWKALGYDLPEMPGWNLDPNLKPSGKFGPLAEDPAWADRAAAAGIVTAAQASGADSCGTDDQMEPFPLDDVYGTEEPSAEQAARPETGGGASSSTQTALAVGGEFPPGIPPIEFEFGPGWLETGEQSWASLCPPECDDQITVRFLTGPFEVYVEQVFNKFGNAPFDPQDPLGGSLEDQPQTQIGITDPPTVVTPPTTPPRTSPPSSPPPSAPTNPLSAFTGSYAGDGACGVSSTRFGTQGDMIVTLTIPPNGTVRFDIDPSNDFATSQSNNLEIFGSPGHSCNVNNLTGGNRFELGCVNTSGGFCNEVFTR